MRGIQTKKHYSVATRNRTAGSSCRRASRRKGAETSQKTRGKCELGRVSAHCRVRARGEGYGGET